MATPSLDRSQPDGELTDTARTLQALRRACLSGVDNLERRAHEQARSNFRTALQIHPGCAVALMGNVLLDIQEAHGDFAAASAVKTLRCMAKLTADSVRRRQMTVQQAMAATAYRTKHDPSTSEVDDTRADLFFRFNLGAALHVQGGAGDAERVYTHVIETLRRAQSSNSTGLGHTMGAPTSTAQRGSRRKSDEGGGEGGGASLGRDSTAQGAQLAASLPQGWHALLVSAQLNLGLVRSAAGRYGEACKQYRGAIAVATAGAEAELAKHMPPSSRGVLDIMALAGSGGSDAGSTVGTGSVFDAMPATPGRANSPGESAGPSSPRGGAAPPKGGGKLAEAIIKAVQSMSRGAQSYVAQMRSLLVTAYTALASSQMKLGAPLPAVRILFGKALALDGTFVPALAGAATVDEITGRLSSAVALLSRAVQLCGAGAGAGLWAHLAKLLLALGRQPDAQACFVTAMQMAEGALEKVEGGARGQGCTDDARTSTNGDGTGHTHLRLAAPPQASVAAALASAQTRGPQSSAARGSDPSSRRVATMRHSQGGTLFTPAMSLQLAYAQCLLAGGAPPQVAAAGDAALDILSALGVDTSARTAVFMKEAEHQRVQNAREAAGVATATPPSGDARGGTASSITPSVAHSEEGAVTARVRDPHSIDWMQEGVSTALVVWASSAQRTGRGGVLRGILEAYLPAIQAAAVQLHDDVRTARTDAAEEEQSSMWVFLNAKQTRRVPALPRVWCNIALLYCMWGGLMFEAGNAKAASGAYYAASQALRASEETENIMNGKGVNGGSNLLGSQPGTNIDTATSVPCWWSLGVVRNLYSACSEFGVGVCAHLLARPDRALRHYVRALNALAAGRAGAHANSEGGLKGGVTVPGPIVWGGMGSRVRYCMALALEGVSQTASAEKQLGGVLETLTGEGGGAVDASARAGAALAALLLRCSKSATAVVLTTDLQRGAGGSNPRLATAHALAVYHSSPPGHTVEPALKALQAASSSMSRGGGMGFSMAVAAGGGEGGAGAATLAGLGAGDTHPLMRLGSLLDYVYVHFARGVLLHLRHVRQWTPAAVPGVTTALHLAGGAGGGGSDASMMQVWQRDSIKAGAAGDEDSSSAGHEAPPGVQSRGPSTRPAKSTADALSAVEEYGKALRYVSVLAASTNHLATNEELDSAASRVSSHVGDALSKVKGGSKSKHKRRRRPASARTHASPPGGIERGEGGPDDPEGVSDSTSGQAAGRSVGGASGTFLSHIRALQMQIRTCLGCAHASVGSLSNALIHLTAAQDLDPDNRIVQSATGAVQSAIQKNSSADKAYMQALSMYKGGDFVQAAGLLRKAKGGAGGLGGGSRSTLLYGLCLGGQGAFTEALKFLRGYLKAWPDDLTVHLALSAACYRMFASRQLGPFSSSGAAADSAVTHAHLAIGLAGPTGAWQAHTVLGFVHSARSKHSGAAASFKSAASACPRVDIVPQLWLLTGLAARAMGAPPQEVADAFTRAADTAADAIGVGGGEGGVRGEEVGLMQGLLLGLDGGGALDAVGLALDDEGGVHEPSAPPAGPPSLKQAIKAHLAFLRGRALWEAGLQFVGSNKIKPAIALLERAVDALEHNSVFQVVSDDEGTNSNRNSLSSRGAGGLESPPPSGHLAPSPTGAWAGFLPVPFSSTVRSSTAEVNTACTSARKLLVDVHCTLAVCHIRQRDAAAAAAAALCSLAYNPHHAAGLVALGDAYSGANKHAMAAKLYSSAARGRTGGGSSASGDPLAQRLQRALALAGQQAAMLEWRKAHPQLKGAGGV